MDRRRRARDDTTDHEADIERPDGRHPTTQTRPRLCRTGRAANLWRQFRSLSFTLHAMSISIPFMETIDKAVDRFASLGLPQDLTRRQKRLYTAVCTPVPWAGALIIGSAVAGGVWADGGAPADVTNDAIMWGLAVAFVASMWAAVKLMHGPAVQQPEVLKIRFLSLCWWAATTIAVGVAVTIFPATAGAPVFGWALLAAAPVGGMITAGMLAMAALGADSPQVAAGNRTPAVSC